ncbi:sensor histidine kinase [Sciscionella marina]|uniref:sensor histidine kinase n=1 Tax=Sciscionella marina TaxID=508770 RepID=UPI00039EE5B0|nr:histidine kinase [Sciscionella marina]
MLAIATRVKARIEHSSARLGVPYPWWVPAWATAASTIIAVAALIQRYALAPGWLVVAGVLLYGHLVVWIVTGRMLRPWMEALLAAAAVVVLLLGHPVSTDIAPWLLTVAVAEVAATSRPLITVAAAVLGSAIPIVAGLTGYLESAPVYVVGVLLGTQVGITLRWQIRALAAERTTRTAEREQAVLAERQRIAREVHDVVGHSLSITLLHVTGARHALTTDGDLTEAIEALTEAERIGRGAMTDIRRSVGLLPADQPSTEPLPDLAEITTLVERTRGAGVEMQYQHSGDPGTIDATCGLGLYRIAQESLANIVKHAPGSTANVLLRIDRDRVRLTIRNTLPSGEPVRRDTGTGLDGITTRAGQLGAELTVGPQRGGHWIVDVSVPLEEPEPVRRAGSCPIRSTTPRPRTP